MVSRVAEDSREGGKNLSASTLTGGGQSFSMQAPRGWQDFSASESENPPIAINNERSLALTCFEIKVICWFAECSKRQLFLRFCIQHPVKVHITLLTKPRIRQVSRSFSVSLRCASRERALRRRGGWQRHYRPQKRGTSQYRPATFGRYNLHASLAATTFVVLPECTPEGY